MTAFNASVYQQETVFSLELTAKKLIFCGVMVSQKKSPGLLDR